MPASQSTRRDWLVLLVLVSLALAWSAWVQQRQRGQEDTLAVALAQAARAGDIEMFSTSVCPYCAKARMWMTDHHIAFSECNTQESAACATRFSRLGSAGVPTFVVRGEVQVGFEPTRLARSFGL